MKASLNWLAELLPNAKLETRDITALAYELDMTGTAVEAISKGDDQLEGVVIGHILEKERHPNSDHLWVTKVDIGGEEPLQIVCGAQNFEAGDKTPVAPVGTVLPGDFKIKKSKIRDVVSFGMNCSARELGLGTEHDGIMILPADAPVGVAFSAWKKDVDTVIEFEITPNRADCLSMTGLAREIAAVLKTEVQAPSEIALNENADSAITDKVSIEVMPGAETPRYMGRLIEGIKVGPSPEWLAQKVESAGARSINNIVDATNFILFEMGQPLHAFDYDKLIKDEQGIARISIRKAEEGETITTLDDIERRLDTRDTLICDERGGICIAGVMGGANTEVDEQTTSIFLEAAVFSHASISRTSRRLGLISEASLRFERKVDRVATPEILDRAAALIAELGGGTVANGTLDSYVEPHEPLTLTLSLKNMAALIGYEIEKSEVERILESLGFELKALDVNRYEVLVPSYRADVTREVDIFEEVLRLYGMENIPASLSRGYTTESGLTPAQKLRNKIGATLRSQGLNEAMSYPYQDESELEKYHFELPETLELVRLHNPMTSEQSVLRPSLVPSLLKKLSLNQSRGVKDVHLYEIGSVFVTSEGRKLPIETEMVAGLLAGSWRGQQWNDPATALDFFDAKGIIEELALNLRVEKLRFKESERPFLQPGRGAEVLFGKERIGWLGELHPLVAESFDIEGSCVIFELDVTKLISNARDISTLSAPQKFPAIEHDIALIVDTEISAEDIMQRIMNYGRKARLESVALFDLYTGKGIESGKKSLAFKLVYRAADRTLNSEEVEKAQEVILSRLEKDLGAKLRA